MGACQADLELFSCRIPLDNDDEGLGAVVVEALRKSPEENLLRSWMGIHRKGSYRSEHEVPLAYDPDQNDKLARLFGLNSRRGLFNGMRLVSVFQELGGVTFTPTWRKGAAFCSFREDAEGVHDAIVRLPATNAELGSAARDALARSSG